MKWKNQVWVFDDIVPPEHQEKIKKALFGPGFDWHFVSDVTGGGARDMRPAFSHTFIRDGSIKTDHPNMKMLEPLWMASLSKVKEMTGAKANYAIVAARTFLQLPLATLSGSEYDAHHIDSTEQHFAVLYYACDADGDTVIFENMYSKHSPKAPEPQDLKEKIRVTPKQGRVVIFDGYHWHTATQPRLGVRCVINTDILQNG